MAKPRAPHERDRAWYDSLPPGSKPADNNTKRVLPKFVRGELTEQEKAHVKAQQFNWDDIVETVVQLVESDYKLTIARDTFNSSFACWITPQTQDNPNYGLVLSGRGPSVLAAFAVAFYKHLTKFDGVWPKADESPPRDQWG